MASPDPEKLNALMGKLVGDLGAAAGAALVLLGDRLGIYKAMADGKAVTPEDLAAKTGLNERYLREWLSAQAAAGYIDYNPKSKKFKLTPEQACAFADEGGPAFFAGAFEIAQAMWMDEPKICVIAVPSSENESEVHGQTRPAARSRSIRICHRG